jgi:Cap4 SAVED domain
MVHARLPQSAPIEIWLGESKLWEDGSLAVADAISSVRAHIDAGFLSNEKLLIGPQIPKSTPRYEEIISIFKKQTSLDVLLKSSVFAIGILCDSQTARAATQRDATYLDGAKRELLALSESLSSRGLTSTLRIILLYIPLAGKAELVRAFDARLKGLQ